MGHGGQRAAAAHVGVNWEGRVVEVRSEMTMHNRFVLESVGYTKQIG